MQETLHTNACRVCSACEVHSRCVFSNLPDGVVHSRLKSCSRAVTIYRQGAPSAYIYFVRSGWVERSHVQPSGKVVKFMAGKGDLLGLPAVITGKPHESTANAITDVELLCVPAGHFLSLLRRYPLVAENALRQLSHQALSTLDALYSLAVKTPTVDRLWSLLEELGESCGTTTAQGKRINLPLSVKDLADRIGCSRQWATQLLKELESAGLIKRRRGWITLVNGRPAPRYAEESAQSRGNRRPEDILPLKPHYRKRNTVSQERRR